jgi:hypothetical protein
MDSVSCGGAIGKRATGVLYWRHTRLAASRTTARPYASLAWAFGNATTAVRANEPDHLADFHALNRLMTIT